MTAAHGRGPQTNPLSAQGQEEHGEEHEVDGKEDGKFEDEASSGWAPAKHGKQGSRKSEYRYQQKGTSVLAPSPMVVQNLGRI